MASAAVIYACATLALLGTAAGVFFLGRGVYRMVQVIRSGAPESGRWDHPWKRTWTALRLTLSHETFKNRPLIKVAHWLIMVAFVLLILALFASYGQLFSPDFALPLIGRSIVWAWLVEILAALSLLSIVTLFVIRTVTAVRAQRDHRPRSSRFFGSTRWQAWFVEAVIASVSAAILIDHALTFAYEDELGLSPSPSHYPLTAWLGSAWDSVSPTALANAIIVVVTVKILVSMAWMVVVGLDLAMTISWHRFLAPVNLAAGRSADGRKSLGALALPLVGGNASANLEEEFTAAEENFEAADTQGGDDETHPPAIGLGSTWDLTWKDRLDFLSCTECGRCQDLCPAWNTEKPLSPKLLMMALRDNTVAASGFTAPGQAHADTADVLGALSTAKTTGPDGVSSKAGPLVPDVVNADVLWDCTMCGACVEQCPVDISHIDHMGNMSRDEVLLESSFPRELQRPFRSMETKLNPYNQSPRKRLDWAKNLDFDVTVVGEDVEDATGLDYLFWGGCAGAYDEKAKRTTAAVAELLHTAGVTFGVLGSAEGCTGDPARRAGNEILFQMLAGAAIETLQEVKAQKIVVTCAHCFNTILNEFPQLGGHFEVVHHTQLLNRLVRGGDLVPLPPSPEEAQKVTYHDPCFLGRHNRVFAPPRELLGAEPGLELVEMKQNRELATCCGAGGARAWMEEDRGTRIASLRVDQALATGATTVATACPFCTQMLDSAVPSAADLQVKDVAVLLLEGVRRGQEGTHRHQ